MANINYVEDDSLYDNGTYSDAPYDDARPERGGSLTRMAHVIGALMSLVLVAGVGVWGYQLMMRDVSGVPVVRALEGPMRVQPENPGGRQADHQGLAVNSVAADGTAEAPANELRLAPRPVDLLDEDQPLPALGEAAADEGVNDAEVSALIEGLVAAARPIETLKPLNTQEAVSDAGTATVNNAVLTGSGLAASLRPQVRPARLETTVTTATGAVVTPGPATSDAREVDAASLPVGTRLAQLGAFETDALARAAWEKLSVQFEDYMTDKSLVVQEASSGGRSFYRLRAMGFDDLADARRFCAVLIAEQADCIPVTIR